MASEAKENPTNNLIMAIAENLQGAVVEMIYRAREYGDMQFVSAVMDALDDEVGEIRDRLKAEIDDNRQRAEEAEQQLTTERARHASMAAEFEKIAAGKHPRYWTLEPGDVLFRPTEVRAPLRGEYHQGYLSANTFINCDIDGLPEPRIIYRRIDAPAAAEPAAVQGTESVPVSANTQAKVHAILHERGFSGYESPPVSEQPKLTEWQPVRRLDGDGYAVRRDLAGGGCEHIGMPLLFNDARILAAYHNGRLHEVKPVPPVSEQEGERAKWKNFRIGSENGCTCIMVTEPDGVRDVHATVAKFSDFGPFKASEQARLFLAYLNGSSIEHATIREQAEEIERLRKLAAGVQVDDGEWVKVRPHGDDVSLAGPDRVEIKQMDDLIRYCVTVRKRFGNTAVVFDLKPGDVCYRPTGETRPPKNGEWYQFRNSETIDNAVSDWNDVVENHRKIYRRLESPANQIADAEKMVEPSPAPAEEPERGSLRSELERLAGSLESGDCTRKWASKFLWTIIEDLDGIYSTSPTTIREQAEEIELIASGKHPRHWTMEPGDVLFRPTGEARLPREGEYILGLKNSSILCVGRNFKEINRPIYRRIDAPAAAQSGEETILPAQEKWSDAVVPSSQEAKPLCHEVPEPLPPPVSEQKPSLQQVTELVREHGSFHKAQVATNEPSPSLPAGDGEAEPVSSGLDWMVDNIADPGESPIWVLDLNRAYLTHEQAESARDWILKRSEIEAQLAKYKRDADAWEAVRKRNMWLTHYRFGNVIDWTAAAPSTGETPKYKDPVNAVLALAAQLEQKGEGK